MGGTSETLSCIHPRPVKPTARRSSVQKRTRDVSLTNHDRMDAHTAAWSGVGRTMSRRKSTTTTAPTDVTCGAVHRRTTVA